MDSEDDIFPEVEANVTHIRRSTKPIVLADRLPSTSRSERWKRQLLSRSLHQTLDRVNVLGDDMSGHTGCVNALSWAQDGEILLSGGDDHTVRIWRTNPADDTQEYPLACTAIIRTGHRGNIFNNKMLPFSSRIATVAGDNQVRVFDINDALGHPGGIPETHYRTRDTCIRVFRCHQGATKRIVTEESPDLFLVCSEDGTVRQHDLRHPHTCSNASCPPPLIKVPHDIYSIDASPLAPYQFVVAGESQYGYLFDRRQVGRSLQEEWGMLPDSENVATCVRRFGREAGQGRRREYITGVRMAHSNSHEVLLSHAHDAVYLYSTRDDPGYTDAFSGKRSPSSILSPNSKRVKVEETHSSEGNVDVIQRDDTSDVDMIDTDSSHTHVSLDSEQAHADVGEDDGEWIEDDDEGDENDGLDVHPGVPVIFPRMRYPGACNVETIKDVNFLGPEDEFVASGSDDGNFFLWKKASGVLHGIYEGDASVVNVIEGHPHLPLVAVSGIDTTVKLFAPARKESTFSRLQNAEAIMERNGRTSTSRSNLRSNITQLLYQYNLAVGAEDGDQGRGGPGAPPCTFQ